MRISALLRARLFERSGGQCEHGCGRTITLDTFHVAHLRAHANGGPEFEDNLQAWCTRCNYDHDAVDAADTRQPPREWQLEALDPVVARIKSDGAATVSAAPGAGKTVFAGLVFEALRDADFVDRMVVLTPRRTLVGQWARALVAARHIQLKPDAPLERRGQQGTVMTYAALLTQENVDLQRRIAAGPEGRTLLVLDEVHHVGEPADGGSQPAWARSVAEFAGTVDKDLHVAGVLNMSGTLWRSKSTERISTVRYRTLAEGTLESMVDYEVPAERLILAGELRALDLFRLDARIKISDLTKLQTVDSNLADLDEPATKIAIGALSASADWRQAFVESVLRRLEVASRSLDGLHAKALIVAARQDDARQLAVEVNCQMQARGLRPLAEVAVSDDNDAVAVLERFKKAPRSGVLCTVDMAGEGYDCPEIVVVGYASNKLTTLYVRQVVARAMRVTRKERDAHRILPAAIVVPDVSAVVDKIASYLAPFVREVFQTDAEQPTNGVERDGGQQTLLPRYTVESVTPGNANVTVPHVDGTRYDLDGAVVAQMEKELAGIQVPEVYAARILAAAKRTIGDILDNRPFDGLPSDAAALDAFIAGVKVPSTPPSAPPTTESVAFASIEDRAKLLQAAMKRLEGWWHYNGGSAVAVFASEANVAAGIRKGHRGQADLPKLERALEYEKRTIRTLCVQKAIQPPRGV
jgi:superfamily II DNA or RNA helicase